MDKKHNYKRKNYYHKSGGGGSNNWNTKKKFKNYLQTGMKGFLCTCNAKFREKECVKESLNILNEYADKIFGSDDIQRTSSNPEESEGAVACGGDIEDDLKNEISNLRASQWTPGRFTVVDTDVEAIIFIKTILEDPVKLAHTVLSDAATTKTQKARSLLRLVPIEVVCKANMEDIKATADTLFDKHFICEPLTFAVVVNKRYNNSLSREEVIHVLAQLVTEKNQEHRANLKEPNRTVLVEIFKGFCLLSVLEDYKTLKHYNIAELTKPEQGEESEVKEKKNLVKDGADDCENEKEKDTVSEEVETNSSVEVKTNSSMETTNSSVEDKI